MTSVTLSTTNNAYNTTQDPGYNGNITDVCNSSYVPTVHEFYEGLGALGPTVLSMGGITTVVLYALFIQQMYHTYSNTHKAYRRHIYWLISIYPFMTLMSTLSLIVPRSYRVCNAVKITYMSIGVGHFADLTIMMHGSENKMVSDVKDRLMRLDLGPLCCLFKFLPTPPVSKSRMVFVKWMVWQMKWTQGLYYIVLNIWTTGLQNKYGTVDPEVSFLWLSILNFSSFLSGVWALNIMCNLSAEHLEKTNYRRKSLAVKVLILTTKFQNFIFIVLNNSGVYPCISKYITPTAFMVALENSIYLFEMIIFGTFSYFMYRHKEFHVYEKPVMNEKGQYTKGGIVIYSGQQLFIVVRVGSYLLAFTRSTSFAIDTFMTIQIPPTDMATTTAHTCSTFDSTNKSSIASESTNSNTESYNMQTEIMV